MSRGLCVGTLGTLLFAGPFLGASWAQNKVESGPPFPGGADITFQWIYSCPNSRGCSFSCPGLRGASHVTKLIIYLGTIPLGSKQDVPAVFYDFSTLEIPRANGFSISAGLGTLSCQVNGMALDYSGPQRAEMAPADIRLQRPQAPLRRDRLNGSAPAQ